jgi:uncharacterized membrane protein HdeD (DUF308 family)
MSEITQGLRESSRTGTALGIATIIFGLIALFWPMVSGLTVTAVVGVLLIAAGIARTIFAFKAESFGRGVLVFLFGGLSILCGVVMLARPLFGLASLTILLASYFLVDGIFEIVAAFKVRGERGWFWLAVGGIVSIALAYLIAREWPLSGAWAVGILVGIRLIFAGWSMIALGAVGEAATDELEAEVG